MSRRIGHAVTLSVAGLLALSGAAVHSASHSWDVHEIFSNSDGTIQFIELWEANGMPNETDLDGKTVFSNTEVFIFPGDVASPTTNRRILLATSGFAALPGAPPVDYIIVDDFFSTGGDTITYWTYDATTFGAGQLPTDGINSFFKANV